MKAKEIALLFQKSLGNKTGKLYSKILINVEMKNTVTEPFAVHEIFFLQIKYPIPINGIPNIRKLYSQDHTA